MVFFAMRLKFGMQVSSIEDVISDLRGIPLQDWHRKLRRMKQLRGIMSYSVRYAKTAASAISQHA